jgi:acyl carrier protein
VPQHQFTFDDLRDVLINRIGVAADRITDDPNATFDQMGLDSLAFVELQLAMRQQYGIEINDEDASKITTVGGAISYTNERLAAQA